MRKLFILLLFFSVSGHAVDIQTSPTQLRLFVGNQTVSPGQVNTQLEAGGLNKFSSIANFGIEGTFAVLPMVNFGVRGEGKWQKVKETAATSADPQNPYYSSVQQSVALAIVRVDIVNTPIVKVDAFGGAGTASTSMDIRTAGGDANYSHPMSSLISSAGASVGVGYSNIYFLVEVGQEWNKISGLTKPGASSPAIDAIDLSGTYVSVGVIFNGLPSWIHRTK